MSRAVRTEESRIEKARDADTQEPAPRPAARRSRRPVVIALGVVVAAAVAAAVVFLVLPSRPAVQPAAAPPATQSVIQGDLVDRVRANGKLSYGQAHDLGTTLGGTVTGLPAVGSTIGQGGELFRVNDQPVVLLHGELPVWRSFQTGMEDGADVLQLENSLAALGFFYAEPDQRFSIDTVDAIKRWQRSLGLDQTGAIELGRVVFSPTDVRVAANKVAVGAAAGPAVLTVSGTGKLVSVSVDPALKAAVVPGTAVTVVLPNGTEAKGKVAGVGAPVQEDDPAGGKKLTLPVTVKLDNAAAANGVDDADVTVLVSQVKVKNALQVPVLALLARPGGGYVVEVLQGVKSRQVPVQLGLFADGMVQVTGGLKAGDKVVVGDD